MKTQHLQWAAFLVAAIASVGFWPTATQGADSAAADPKTAALVRELQAQQAVVAANQAKIDEQIAGVAEEIRLARIFVSRGGAK